jgi:hypothetical protein
MSVQMEEELYGLVEKSVDYAITQKKYMFNMYSYLKDNKLTKNQVTKFIESPTAVSLSHTITELDGYLEGGNDSEHKLLREAYGHLGKPDARKIRNYLHGILNDAQKYEQERRPGRKRKIANK